MKNTSQGVFGGMAMNAPIYDTGWWVGLGREAPQRTAGGWWQWRAVANLIS